MKLQKIKKILAAVLIGSMISTLPVSAGEIQSPGQTSETVGEEQENSASDTDVQEDISDKDASEAETVEKTQNGDNEAGDGIVSGEEPKSIQGNVQEEESIEELKEELQEEAGESEGPDERTQAIIQEYKQLLREMRTQAVGTYSSELAKFPASYQAYLKELHKKHPNWIFVAVNSSLKWDDIVSAESVSSSSKGTNRSLLPKTSEGLLLSKASTDYNASTGSYIPKDGSTWVSASKPAVAYYADPRNFLTDNYIFMFEALNYNSGYHKIQGVQNVLKGTDLYNKKISYRTTDNKIVSVDMTYDQAIYAAGKKNKISPLFLAAKIRQETGAKLSNGSISGDYTYGGKSYRGYYNYYNIGAYSTSTGSPVANGLYYAKGGKTNSKSYGRPWSTPILSIDGGAQYIASAYILKGQNTVYFQRFNTVYSPYYQHQYMQNLTAAASEAKTTYNSYNNMGIVNDSFVFYIPVYKNMPSQTSAISIKKSVNTGKTTSSVTMRKGPSTSTASLTTIPKGKEVKLAGAEYTDMSASVSAQEKNPYWYKVTYGSKTGYVSSRYIEMNTDSTVKVGGTKQLSVSGIASGEKVYYETSNPAIAKVDVSGKVTGVKNGTCMIYAVTSSGKHMDAIGITVSGTATASTSLSKPKLVSVSNSKSGVVIKWKKVSKAKGYYVYRKASGGKYKKIKKITSGSTVKYTDKSMSSGKKYTYTVKAYNGSKTSSYDKKGLTIRRLSTPKVTSAKSVKSGITVKWKKVKSAVEYEVYRKEKGGKYSKIAFLEGKNVQSYTDKTAKKGVTYYYTVKACSGKYKGAYNSTGVKGIRK